MSVTCDRTVVFSGSSGFLHQLNLPPRCPYNWNIVESGVKHHQTNMFVNKKVHLRSVFGYMYMYLKMDSCVGHFKSRHFEYYIICAQQGKQKQYASLMWCRNDPYFHFSLKTRKLLVFWKDRIKVNCSKFVKVTKWKHQMVFPAVFTPPQIHAKKYFVCIITLINCTMASMW